MSDRLFDAATEIVADDPDGWHFTTKKHAAHDCGWTHASPFEHPAKFHAAIRAHAAVCPWPDMPVPEPSVSD